MTSAESPVIAAILDGDAKDLGEFTVRRTLPHPARQRVGPFIFWDHMGPAEFPPGAGVSVRPHPHIGLATITYLFEGVIMHRDSLGHAQPITRGEVNWMTAGRGIVHSERSPEELVESGSSLHGIQAWVALPHELEETEPRFEHYTADQIPVVDFGGARATIIAGEAWDEASPVQTSSPTLYVEADLDAGGSIATPGGVDELAVYPVDRDVSVEGEIVAGGRMAVLNPGVAATIEAQAPSKVMILGGATLPGERILWWNFVSSSRERLDQAKRDWREDRFESVPGDTEFIPLPDK
jgi:redox-sensitive bicupin YhaK (pirin superfamily)